MQRQLFCVECTSEIKAQELVVTGKCLGRLDPPAQTDRCSWPRLGLRKTKLGWIYWTQTQFPAKLFPSVRQSPVSSRCPLSALTTGCTPRCSKSVLGWREWERMDWLQVQTSGFGWVGGWRLTSRTPITGSFNPGLLCDTIPDTFWAQTDTHCPLSSHR